MTKTQAKDPRDPATYERPSVAVDLVLMSIVDDAPAVLILRRPEPPFKDEWALPGGFVRIDEALDDAARRILRDKARMDGAYVEQLYTFGALGRDPRTRVVTTAYLALLSAERFAAALRAAPELKLAKVLTAWAGEVAARPASP
jgi:8-oxo-dGTP diphosphatase